jgi:oxygen-independent coproporphyrinogen-3 oxidase
MTQESSTVGLYVHIPYCRALCHYCDFAKTANWDEPLRQAYLGRVVEHAAVWLEALGPKTRLASVFLGGGTPSIYAGEYEALLELARPRLVPGAELTLEGNPDDLDAGSLRAWRGVGFNRLSIGVQTFEEQGLRFMKRAHDPRAATAAVERARATFDDVNVDLIYGWPGQTEAGFAADIDRAVALGATHLSLYTLTYEPRTPIGRAAARGRISPADDELLASLYERARESLARHGFQHEEVSNWACPGHACRHNALYWQDLPYLGVGVGAHGYLEGLRYQYKPDDRRFVRRGRPSAPAAFEAEALEQAFDIVVDRGRNAESWLIEYVGSSLRSIYGVDLRRVESLAGKRFKPNRQLEQGLAAGAVKVTPAGRLTLDPAEWFRETAWSLQVLASFTAIS